MATDFLLHVMFKPACGCCCRNRHCESGAAEAARGAAIEVQVPRAAFRRKTFRATSLGKISLQAGGAKGGRRDANASKVGESFYLKELHLNECVNVDTRQLSVEDQRNQLFNIAPASVIVRPNLQCFSCNGRNPAGVTQRARGWLTTRQEPSLSFKFTACRLQLTASLPFTFSCNSCPFLRCQKSFNFQRYAAALSETFDVIFIGKSH